MTATVATSYDPGRRVSRNVRSIAGPRGVRSSPDGTCDGLKGQVRDQIPGQVPSVRCGCGALGHRFRRTDAVRAPRRGLASYPATELGSRAIRAALDRVGLEPGEVEYVIMGQVLQAGVGQAPARQAAVAAGIPKEIPADTINKVCASSIRAIEIADLMIRAGGHELVVTGGMESMSNAPYLLPKARFGYRLGNGEVVDHMVFDGLTSTFDGLHMVAQASMVSRELGISREEQDEWASAPTSELRRRRMRPLRRRDRRRRRGHGRRGRA